MIKRKPLKGLQDLDVSSPLIKEKTPAQLRASAQRKGVPTKGKQPLKGVAKDNKEHRERKKAAEAQAALLPKVISKEDVLESVCHDILGNQVKGKATSISINGSIEIVVTSITVKKAEVGGILFEPSQMIITRNDIHPGDYNERLRKVEPAQLMRLEDEQVGLIFKALGLIANDD